MFKTGDLVRVTTGDVTHDAEIAIASENGKALVIMMQIAIFGKKGLAIMPIYLEDDGTYTHLVTRKPVKIESREGEPVETRH